MGNSNEKELIVTTDIPFEKGWFYIGTKNNNGCLDIYKVRRGVRKLRYKDKEDNPISLKEWKKQNAHEFYIKYGKESRKKYVEQNKDKVNKYHYEYNRRPETRQWRREYQRERRKKYPEQDKEYYERTKEEHNRKAREKYRIKHPIQKESSNST